MLLGYLGRSRCTSFAVKESQFPRPLCKNTATDLQTQNVFLFWLQSSVQNHLFLPLFAPTISCQPQFHVFDFPFSLKTFLFSSRFFLLPFVVSCTTRPSSSPCGLNSRSCSSAWDQLCECVTASCRRDWRWLSPLRPHCSSWQGRSWELFNGRRIGGSASHRHPPPHTYTHALMHTSSPCCLNSFVCLPPIRPVCFLSRHCEVVKGAIELSLVNTVYTLQWLMQAARVRHVWIRPWKAGLLIGRAWACSCCRVKLGPHVDCKRKRVWLLSTFACYQF